MKKISVKFPCGAKLELAKAGVGVDITLKGDAETLGLIAIDSRGKVTYDINNAAKFTLYVSKSSVDTLVETAVRLSNAKIT